MRLFVAINLPPDLRQRLWEAAARVAEGYSASSMLVKLAGERRAVRVRIAGEERWIAAQDGGTYRDAHGADQLKTTLTTAVSRATQIYLGGAKLYGFTDAHFAKAEAAAKPAVEAAQKLESEKKWKEAIAAWKQLAEDYRGTDAAKAAAGP